MDDKTREQMAKMVNALQPHCDEQIAAAMTCSQSGSMGSLLIGSLATKLISGLTGQGGGGGSQAVKLPNPVFIAVGSKSIYAYAFTPRGFNYKIKKEVARWPRDEVSVETENTGAMATFKMTMGPEESYKFEIPTIMGARELVEVFFEALEGS